MPKQVDHRQRQDLIARALWQVVDQHGWAQASMREVAREAGASLGQVQHYFSSRTEMLTFAMEHASAETSHRIQHRLDELETPDHPREVLRIVLTEMLPLYSDSRARSRMSAAYVLEALHDESLREQARAGLRDGRSMVESLIRQAITDGHIARGRDPVVETNLLLALTGFTPLLELGVIDTDAVLKSIDDYLDRLFAAPQTSMPLRCCAEAEPHAGGRAETGTAGTGGEGAGSAVE